MSLNPRKESDWTLIASDYIAQSRDQQGHCLIMPPVKQPGSVPLCLLGLLPNHNHNRELLDVLGSIENNAFARRATVAGIFAADSFLPWADLLRALERVGIHKVTNFPTVAAYGALIEKTLSDVDIGFEREYEILSRFRQHGFETAAVLTQARHKAMIREQDNFALIELARSDKQVSSKLFNRKSPARHLFITPNATLPESGCPPHVDGLILAAGDLS